LINLSHVQDEVLREAHKIVERQVHQIIRLVDDMLDISRIMRGQLAVRAELLDVRKIIQEAGDLHRPLFGERDQTLTLSLPAEPLWIRADPGRLRQVLTNLLNNAMKYTEPKGQIFVDAGKQDDRVVICVRDTGVGIEEDLLPGIFDMFAQGPQHKHQGLGIGLALVRALVETHGGTIKADSAGPGKGSEFTIELPEARQGSPQTEPTSAEKHTTKATACYRILLVEDHQDGAHTLAVLLERNGHEVRLASDGREALDIALKYKPDVILIDIGLPDINGYEVARALRQNDSFANTALIALSGYATDNDRDRARQATFDHHLAKPVDLEALQTLLATFRRRR
jgi:CheY-like chemotaxis protein